MVNLKITNWDTCSDMINWTYSNMLRIEKTVEHNYNQYVFRFFKDGKEVCGIGISRKPIGDRYVVRGKNFRSGKYSNIYKLTKGQIGHTAHVRYVFNKIIDEICL